MNSRKSWIEGEFLRFIGLLLS